MAVPHPGRVVEWLKNLALVGHRFKPPSEYGVASRFLYPRPGAGARGVAQTLLHPIDVARTRLQAKGVPQLAGRYVRFHG